MQKSHEPYRTAMTPRDSTHTRLSPVLLVLALVVLGLLPTHHDHACCHTEDAAPDTPRLHVPMDHACPACHMATSLPTSFPHFARACRLAPEVHEDRAETRLTVPAVAEVPAPRAHGPPSPLYTG